MAESRGLPKNRAFSPGSAYSFETKGQDDIRERECRRLSVELQNAFITRDVIWNQVLETDSKIKNLTAQIQQEARREAGEGARDFLSGLITAAKRLVGRRNPLAVSAVARDFLSAILAFNRALRIQLSGTARLESEVNLLNFRLREHQETLTKIDGIRRKLRSLQCSRR